MDIQAAVDYVTDWGMVNFAGKHVVECIVLAYRVITWGIL